MYITGNTYLHTTPTTTNNTTTISTQRLNSFE